MTAKVTITYPVPAEDMPLVQFMAGNAPGTVPTPGTTTTQTLINGVVNGPPLTDALGEVWTLTAGDPSASPPIPANALLNGVAVWITPAFTNFDGPPTELRLGSDGVVYLLPADGIWKVFRGGSWYNGTPPLPAPAPGPAPTLPALPVPNPIAPGSSGTTIDCGPGNIAIPTLAAAITLAKAGDTINVAPGTATFTDVPHAISVPLLIDLGGNTWDGSGQDAALPFSGAGFFVIGDGADTIIQNGTVTGVGLSFPTGNNCSAVRVEAAYFTGKNLTLHGNQCAVGSGDAGEMIELDGCNIFNNGLTANAGGSLTHNIYVAARRLTLTNTNSTASVEGYAVKSRGPELIINGGTFSSSPNAKPFDLPNGTTVPFLMTGATILKGAADGDHGILSYGEEGASNGLAGGTISGGAIAALCQNPVISAPNGGTITLSGVALSGNPITGNPLSAVIIK